MLAECESIDEHWEAVKTALCESAEVTIGRRRGKRKEQWIREETWELIDERKQARQRRECAKTPDEARQWGETYSELDRQIKASCRRDKKAWIAQKETEAQTAATRGSEEGDPAETLATNKAVYQPREELSNSTDRFYHPRFKESRTWLLLRNIHFTFSLKPDRLMALKM
ncbi:unnamed protein product [Heligmosomoides polygyrus]|uniref:Clathrin light chain n=1 Tax=Heligmosomoides polygyrus TaxID=6339 RepID=A0A3P8B3W7_HELPZ|nr:unnamed protein product [Heligmosomoides polygyrus]